MTDDQRIKILFIARDDGGCGFFRCRQPATFIRRMGLADTEITLRKASEEQLLNASLVIMQEMGSINASQIAHFCIENQIPYVAEVDDFLHHVSPHNQGGYGAWNPSTLYLYRAMELLQSSFAVTVSTNQLAREYFPYHNLIYVIPNYLDKELWDNPIIKRQDNKIRIGWCGGNAHADDLHLVSQVLNKIIKEDKEKKIVIETIGMTRQELFGVFPMQEIHDTCSACGYEGSIRHFPGLDLKEYPAFMASRGWDIAIAPLINNSFNNCKSDLKIKEYSAAGIPCIASNVVPYKEAAQDGADIILAETFEEWYNAFKYLISNPSVREKMVKNNRQWVGRYWIQDNAQHIFNVYRQLIEKANLIFTSNKNK